MNHKEYMGYKAKLKAPVGMYRAIVDDVFEVEPNPIVVGDYASVREAAESLVGIEGGELTLKYIFNDAGVSINVLQKQIKVTHKHMVKVTENKSLDTNEDYALSKLFQPYALEAIRRGGLFTNYEGLTREQSNALNKLIYQLFTEKEWDLPDLVDKITQSLPIDEAKAETIARTELGLIQNKSMELAYKARMRDENRVYYFAWVGPQDNRTSDTCKEIKATVEREGGKVVLDRLKQIVHDVSKTLHPEIESRDWVPHINCRHSLLRVL